MSSMYNEVPKKPLTSTIGFHIFLVIISLVGGFFIDTFWNWFQNEPRYIEYTVASSGNVIENIADKTQLKVDSGVLTSVGNVDLLVYNTTGKNFSNVGIDVIIERTEENAGRLLWKDYEDANGRKERVKFIGDTVTDKMFKYSFIVSNFINNSDAPALTLHLTFSDVEKLNTSVEVVNQTGLDAKQVKAPDNRKFWESPAWFFSSIAMSAFMLFLYFYDRSDRGIFEQISIALEYSGKDRNRMLVNRLIDIIEKFGIFDDAAKESDQSGTETKQND